MPVSPHYQPAPRFLELGDGFADPVRPASFPSHTLRFRNQRWAARIGLGELDAAEWEAHFARFVPLPGNLPLPLALRYHGHQFRIYNPHLGDGRGFLYAQLRDPVDGRLLDLGTKGSGRTPWSRSGDGRLTLKGGVRELLATEMLEALGVPTSKTLSLFETGESLQRDDEPSPTRSCVLVRLGHSHIRIGTFERLRAVADASGLQALLEHCVRHYYPHLREESDRAAAFLREVSEHSAALAARWMAAGFVHGVLNSDNLNINGESFDYGPWRFLPTYDPGFVAAYFDPAGLYAFGRQPDAVRWNLDRLAEALLPLGSAGVLARALDDFVERFFVHYREALLRRLGLTPFGDDRDAELLAVCRAFLAESQVGHDQFFFDWFGGVASEARAAEGPEAERYRDPCFAALRRAFDAYAPPEPERLSLPYFRRRTPATVVIDEVERLWRAIAERDDWQPLEEKVAEIREMGEAAGRAGPVTPSARARSS